MGDDERAVRRHVRPMRVPKLEGAPAEARDDRLRRLGLATGRQHAAGPIGGRPREGGIAALDHGHVEAGFREQERLPGAGDACADHRDRSRIQHSRPSADTNRIRFKGFGACRLSPVGHPSDTVKMGHEGIRGKACRYPPLEGEGRTEGPGWGDTGSEKGGNGVTPPRRPVASRPAVDPPPPGEGCRAIRAAGPRSGRGGRRAGPGRSRRRCRPGPRTGRRRGPRSGR